MGISGMLTPIEEKETDVERPGSFPYPATILDSCEVAFPYRWTITPGSAMVLMANDEDEVLVIKDDMYAWIPDILIEADLQTEIIEMDREKTEYEVRWA